jgi:hypothetical protein
MPLENFDDTSFIEKRTRLGLSHRNDRVHWSVRHRFGKSIKGSEWIDLPHHAYDGLPQNLS